MAELAYNNHTHSATQLSPYFINYGRHPVFGPINKGSECNPSVEEFGQTIKDVWKLAQSNLEKANERMTRQFGKNRLDSNLKVGDKVLLEGTHLETIRPSKKLSERRYGPFEIIEKVGEAAWKLKIPKGWKRIHPVFHESLLTPYRGLDKNSRPVPDLVGEVKEYEVEKILDK